ncbi:hypothetical protein AB0C61_22695 [Streptomyces sp. NPDC048680]|uniref:hypothetical protein n=1 Tax=Streptomyces sp. NPDC048680 TaxID=3155492 RepID=UPI003412E56E
MTLLPGGTATRHRESDGAAYRQNGPAKATEEVKGVENAEYAEDARSAGGQIVDRQARNTDWWHAHRGASAAGMATEDQITERIAWSHREHAFTTAHRAAFTSALH